MWTSGIPDHTWDEQLFAHQGHFLQSSHWAAFQQALNRPVFYAQGEGWMCLAYVEKGQLGTRLYAPYGPFVAHKNGFDEALKALQQLAKQHNAVYVRVDPTGRLTEADLQTFNLRPAPKDAQPHYTWIKDLTLDESDILGEMAGSNRNLYNTAANKGLTFAISRDPADIKLFLPFIHEVSANTGMIPHSDAYFTTMVQTLMPREASVLYVAYHEGQPVAASITFDGPISRCYAHAGSAASARKLRPGNPMLVHMILDAKANGQKEFDFYGIAPPDQPNHRWAGFTQFKQSFGGFTRAYLGTWELPVKKLHYHAYQWAHKVKGQR